MHKSTVKNLGLEQIIGKKSFTLKADALHEQVQGFKNVVIDFGCGDGMLPYRLAKQNPDCFYIGIDAARESLAVASAKAAKKPSRGGCENVIFLCANVLNPLPELQEIADHLEWNFPWGSLMYALVKGDETALQNMCATAKQGANFTFYLNLYVFENDTQRQDMNLPEIDKAYLEQTLCPQWLRNGLKVNKFDFLPAEDLKDHPSTWAGRLLRRSGRNTLLITGEICHGKG